MVGALWTPKIEGACCVPFPWN